MADIDPILLAHMDREQRKTKRLQLEHDFRRDLNSNFPSQRLARARGFAHQIIGIVNEFIPLACHEKALEELMLSAYALDVEIVHVPPDRDASTAAAIKAAEARLAPQIIIPNTDH